MASEEGNKVVSWEFEISLLISSLRKNKKGGSIWTNDQIMFTEFPQGRYLEEYKIPFLRIIFLMLDVNDHRYQDILILELSRLVSRNSIQLLP